MLFSPLFGVVFPLFGGCFAALILLWFLFSALLFGCFHVFVLLGALYYLCCLVVLWGLFLLGALCYLQPCGYDTKREQDRRGLGDPKSSMILL